MMKHESNIILGGIAEIAEVIASMTCVAPVAKRVFPAFDFAAADIETNHVESADLLTVTGAAHGWYGVKAVDAGFDSYDTLIVADYYGGGCTDARSICQYSTQEQIVCEISGAIHSAFMLGGIDAEGIVIIAEIQDSHYEKLWDEFGDIPMNPTTECMEAQFLQFPVGTHREDIWHWFDELHSKGVHFLLYGEGECLEKN